MPESDDPRMTPTEMRHWLAQEMRDVIKEMELRLKDATEFATAYISGMIDAKEATARLRRYENRWGDPMRGVCTNEEMTNEEILKHLDTSLEEKNRFMLATDRLHRRGPEGPAR